MLASNYYILDLKEGEDFSFDEVDVKKQYKLNFKDEPDQMFKQMYGKYSNFESAKVDKWNMNTFLGKQMKLENMTYIRIILKLERTSTGMTN